MRWTTAPRLRFRRRVPVVRVFRRSADPAIRRERLRHLAEPDREQRSPGTPARPPASRDTARSRTPQAARTRRARSPAAARPTATASTRSSPAGCDRGRGDARRPGSSGASGASGGRSTTPASSRATADTRTGPSGPSIAATYASNASKSAGSSVLGHAERPPDRPRLGVERRAPRPRQRLEPGVVDGDRRVDERRVDPHRQSRVARRVAGSRRSRDGAC